MKILAAVLVLLCLSGCVMYRGGYGGWHDGWHGGPMHFDRGHFPMGVHR